MWHQLITYIKWLPKTYHLHGIHSPFVFDLQQKCLTSKRTYPEYAALKKYKNTLLENKQEIQVTDFGAGSRVFKSNQRRIRAIARHAGATQKRMQLLFRLSAYFAPQTILELGTSLGTGTFSLAMANPLSQVTTLEGCPETAKVAKKALNSFGTKNVEVVTGRFRESLEKLLPTTYDCIYFDGNHSKVATLTYVKKLIPTAHNNSFWIFDDIHWSREMTEAWEEICDLPQITACIDCFWFGIVFFRKEQAKETFYIKA